MQSMQRQRSKQRQKQKTKSTTKLVIRNRSSLTIKQNKQNEHKLLKTNRNKKRIITKRRMVNPGSRYEDLSDSFLINPRERIISSCRAPNGIDIIYERYSSDGETDNSLKTTNSSQQSIESISEQKQSPSTQQLSPLPQRKVEYLLQSQPLAPLPPNDNNNNNNSSDEFDSSPDTKKKGHRNDTILPMNIDDDNDDNNKDNSQHSNLPSTVPIDDGFDDPYNQEDNDNEESENEESEKEEFNGLTQTTFAEPSSKSDLDLDWDFNDDDNNNDQLPSEQEQMQELPSEQEQKQGDDSKQEQEQTDNNTQDQEHTQHHLPSQSFGLIEGNQKREDINELMNLWDDSDLHSIINCESKSSSSSSSLSSQPTDMLDMLDIIEQSSTELSQIQVQRQRRENHQKVQQIQIQRQNNSKYVDYFSMKYGVMIFSASNTRIGDFFACMAIFLHKHGVITKKQLEEMQYLSHKMVNNPIKVEVKCDEKVEDIIHHILFGETNDVYEYYVTKYKWLLSAAIKAFNTNHHSRLSAFESIKYYYKIYKNN